jgi:hypothetical protein
MMKWDNVQRTLFANEAVAKIAGPVLQEVNGRAYKLETLTVAAGIRRAAIYSSTDEAGVLQICMNYGLKAVLMSRAKIYKGFSHRLQEAKPGEPSIGYFAIGKTMADAEELAAAFKGHDSTTEGRLMGYPKCCCDAFGHRWQELQHNDHALIAALDAGGIKDVPGERGDKVVQLGQVGRTQQFFRYAGARLVFHLPCRYDCEESIAISRAHEQLELETWKDNQLLPFLSQPFTATAYRGIMEVTTAEMRIVAATDHTTVRYTITANQKEN